MDEKQIRDEQSAVFEKVAAYRDRLRARGVRLAAASGYNEPLVRAIHEAIASGEFSLTMLLLLGPPHSVEQVAHWEYLNGLHEQGYHGIIADVTLKNIGNEPIHFRPLAKPVPARPRGNVTVKVGNGPLKIYRRTKQRIDPGEEGTVSFGKAITLMTQYCALPYVTEELGSTGGPVRDTLREVCGCVRDNGVEYEWSYDVQIIESPPEKAPVRRRKAKPDEEA